MTFWRENAFISIQIIYTNKWKNGQKRNDFLARKCIYQYLDNIYSNIKKINENNFSLLKNFAKKFFYQYQ